MPMRPAESWYNEYRGLRNDGAVRAEQHLIYIQRIQADAAQAERDAMVQRIIAGCDSGSIPAWLLRAAQTPIALPTSPAPPAAVVTAMSAGLLGHAG